MTGFGPGPEIPLQALGKPGGVPVLGDDGTVGGSGGTPLTGVLQQELAEKANQEPSRPTAVVANSGSAYTITPGRTTVLTLTADCTLTFPSAAIEEPFTLILKQDGTGGRIVHWPGIYWVNGASPTLTSEPAGIDTISFRADKAAWYGSVVGQKYQLPGYEALIKGTEGLVAYYRLDEPSGTKASDSSGKANHGEYKGAPTLGKTGALAASGLADAADKAASFVAASTQYVTVPDNASLDLTDNFTLECWAKVHGASLGKNRSLIAKGDGAYQLRLNEEDKLQLTQQNTHNLAYGALIPNDGAYHHCVATKAGATIKVYVDGVDVTASPTNFTCTDTSEPLLIATGSPTDEKGDFDLDEVAIYNRALTAKEVAARYTLGHGPVTAEDLLLGFESGDFNGWNLAGMGEVEPTIKTDIVKSGTKSAGFKLEGNQNRSELILGGDGSGGFSPVKFGEGDAATYKLNLYMLSMIYGRPGAHNLFWQLYSYGIGPRLSLMLWDYEGDAGVYGGTPTKGKGLWVHGADAGTGAVKDEFKSAITEKAWHEVEIDFVNSAVGAGSYAVKLDGAKLVEATGISTMESGAPYAYIKNGIYRNGGTINGGAGGTSETRIDSVELIRA